MIILSSLALATPNSINIQGKLTSSSGSIQSGTYNITLRLYDNFTSGNKLYETSMVSTSDSRGVFDLIMQDINLPFDKQYYLAVKVDDDAEMEPRINLTSVPYSFEANKSRGLNTTQDVFVNNNINLTAAGNIDAAGTINADVLKAATQLDIGGGFNSGGLTIESDGDIVTQGDVLFSGNVTIINVSHLNVNGSIVPGLDATFDIGNGSMRWRNANFSGLVEIGSLVVDGDTLFVDSTNDRVGVGTTSPATTLDVQGTLNVTGNATFANNTLFVDNTSSKIGIGTASPAAKLDVIHSTTNILLGLGSANSGSWSQVGGDGVGWDTSDVEIITELIVYDGKLYAGMGLQDGDSDVWEYNESDWTQVGGDSLNNGWGGDAHRNVETMTTWNGYLVAGVEGNAAGEDAVWIYDGNRWERIAGDGLGWPADTYSGVFSMTSHNGKLYAGTASGTAGDGDLFEYDRKVTNFAQSGSGITIGDYLFLGRNGKVGIGAQDNSEPSAVLDVRGDFKVSGALLVAKDGFVTSLGRVGIGTTMPNSTLHVVGNVTIDGNLTIGSPNLITNITMYSLDGTEWRCGPDDTGAFVCS